MSIIDTSYFVGAIKIPNVDKSDVSENLEFLIADKESDLLTKILGVEMYDAFTSGLTQDPIDVRWTRLRDGYSYTDASSIKRKWQGLTYDVGPAPKSIIANYVYYWHTRNNATETSGIGEVINTTDNAKRVSPETKQKTAWNEMVESIYDLIYFLQDHASIYPEWKQDYNYYGYCSPVIARTKRGFLTIPQEWERMSMIL